MIILYSFNTSGSVLRHVLISNALLPNSIVFSCIIEVLRCCLKIKRISVTYK